MARKRKGVGDTTQFCRVAYYALNGFGKTTAAADMARLGEVAVIAAEPGLRPARLAELGVPIGNLQVAISTQDSELPYPSFKACDELFWDLRQEYMDGSPTAPIGLMIDTASELQNVLREDTRREELARAKRKDDSYDLSDMFIDVSWHGINATEMNTLLRQYRDLPCHWAVCCQEERREPFLGRGETSIGPMLGPSTQSALIGYSDFVIRIRLKENEDDPKNPIRIGMTEHHDGIAKAKDRDHVLPHPMAEPTFTRVLAYWQGELTVETDPIQQEYLELFEAGTLKDPDARPKRMRRSERLAQGA